MVLKGMYANDPSIIFSTPVTINITSALSSIYGNTPPSGAETGFTLSGCTNCFTLDYGNFITATTGAGSYSYASNPTLLGITYSSGTASDYAVTWGTNNSFTVNRRPVTVTVDAKTKVYGNIDPTLTYSASAQSGSTGLITGQSLTGVLSRAPGETVAGGPYAIQQNTLTNANNGNYDITYTGANLTISRRPITLTATAASKIYGNADPALAVTASASGNGVGLATTANSNTVNDTLADVTGTVARQAGSNAGIYDLTLGAGSQAGNYDITFTADNNAFTIDKRTLTLSATKTYDGNNTLGTVTLGNYGYGETLNYSAATASDSHVLGNKWINAITLSNNTGDIANYQLPALTAYSAGANDATITTRALTLTGSKVYDGSDSFASSLVVGNRVSGESLTISSATANSTHVADNGSNFISAITLASTGTGLTTDYAVPTYAYHATNNNVTLSTRPINITADTKTKVYGNSDPALTYTPEVSGSNRGLVTGDTFTGSLTRVAGETVAVSPYAITQNATLTNSDYAITFVPADLSITQRPITLTATSATKVYGENEAALGVTASATGAGVGIATSANSNAVNDTLAEISGTLTRQSGNNAGAYDVQLGSGSKAANYNISFVTDNNAYSVTRRPVTVTADAKSKTYGDTDPTLTYTNTTGTAGTGVGLLSGDTLSGSLTRVAGETSGTGGVTYQIQQGTVDNGNYNISYVPANLTIGQRAITLTASSATKVYGEADPTFAATVSAGSLANNSGISVVDSIADVAGTLGRSAGSNVGVYDIYLGTGGTVGSKAGNYAITFVTNNNAFAVTQRPIEITADAQSKIYGNADPAFSYVKEANSSGRGLVGGDSFTGSLARVSGETVASYAINSVGTLANSNYAITVVPANLTVTQRPITLTATSASKIYGETDPALAVTATASNGTSGLATTGNSNTVNDSLADVTGTLSREAGTAVGSYDIALGSGGTAGSKAGNYAITFTTDNNAVSVTRRPVTVTADAKSKTYGDTDPALTYTNTTGTVGTGVGLLSGDTLSGSLTRAAGETSGTGGVTYQIQQGTVDNGNYNISYVPANLTIGQKTLTLAGSTGVTKTYSGTTAMPTGSNGYGSLVGLVGSDVVTVAGAPVFSAANQGARTINVGSVAIAGTDAGNYSLSWSNGSGTINAAPLTVTANSDANFVTLASTGVAAYNGVSYSGFVNGEGTGVLGLGSLAITRSGSGPDGNTGGVNTLAGTYTNALTPSGATANNGNYSISYAPGTYTIVPADRLLVTVNNAAFTYGTAPSYSISSAKYLDGSNNIQTLAAPTASGNTYTYSDGSGGTAVFTLGPVSAQTSTNGALKVGSYSIGASNITESSNNFSNNLVVVGALTVNQKGLTATATGLTKVYDGTTAMNNVSLGLTGLETNDVVSISGNGNFSTKSVGSGNKSFTIDSLTLGSTDAANYYLSAGSSLSGANGTITAKALTMSGLTVPTSKVYDATTGAVVSGTPALASFESAGAGTSSDGKAYNGDVVSFSGTATGTYNNKDVSTAATVTFGGLSLTGAEAGNYTLTVQSPANATITAKALTISGLTASGKTYDGNTTATVNGTAALQTAQAPGAGSTSDGKAYTGDTVSVTGTAVGTFNSKNVTAANSVAFTGNTLTGAQAGNYTLTAHAADTSARITTKALAVSGITAAGKTYDGNATATVSTSNASYGGLVGGDSVSVSATGTFSDKNVGSSKTVTLSSSYSGGDVSNYSITNQSSTTADVTRQALTVSGITAASKTYDGTNAATVSTAGSSYGGLVSGDSFTAAATGTFDNKNAGSGKTVTLLSSYSGADVGNYAITDQASTTADVTKKALDVSGITAVSKIYDANRTASVNTGNAAYAGLVAGDALSVSASGLFDSKNVGVGKTVTLSSSYSGADVGNYSITNQATTAANVTPKALTIAGITAASKVYDGNNVASVNTAGVTEAGLVSGDAVNVGATGTFNDKNVGTGKTVTLVSSYSGADVGNYSITDQASTTADVTKKALSVSGISAANKIYDANRTASVNTGNAAYAGLVAGDALAVSATGLFDSKNVGTGKTVALTSSYSGTDAGNYAITDQASTTADITPKGVTVSGIVNIAGITAADKVYDGTRSASVSTQSASYAGLIAGDELTVSATGTFSDKNVGVGKTVTLVSSYSGADATNYVINDQATTTASITAKPMTVSGITAASKVYDGSTSASVSTATASQTGLVAGDVVRVAASGIFSDKNAGVAKTVALTSSYSGADVDNYSITNQPTTTAAITPKPMTVSGITAVNKVYDGSNVATVSTVGVSEAGLVAGDVVSVAATGTFGDKNVGSGKTVTLASSYSGADVGNYAITSQINTTANIDQKGLTLSDVSASNKTYDGLTDVSITLGNLVGVVSGESVGVTGVGSFADPNVGMGKTVNVKLALANGSGGGLASNYVVSDTSTKADINPVPSTVAPLPPSVASVVIPPVSVPTPPAPVAVIANTSTPVDIASTPASTPVASVTSSSTLTPTPTSTSIPAAAPTGTSIAVGSSPASATGSTAASTGTVAAPSTEAPATTSVAVTPAGTSTVMPTATSAATPATATSNATPVPVNLNSAGDARVSASSAESSSSSAASGNASGTGGFISVRSFDATTVSTGSAFSFTLPKDTFQHADARATVALEARMADGKALPIWLNFDPASARFTGNAPRGVPEIVVRVIARDGSGGEASTQVTLRFNASSEVR